MGIGPARRKFLRSWKKRLREEIKRGVQTIQYQVVTLMTTNGQAPFITVFMYLNEAGDNQRLRKRRISPSSSKKRCASVIGASKTRPACGSPLPSPS